VGFPHNRQNNTVASVTQRVVNMRDCRVEEELHSFAVASLDVVGGEAFAEAGLEAVDYAENAPFQSDFVDSAGNLCCYV